jgi:hypothetical protein
MGNKGCCGLVGDVKNKETCQCDGSPDDPTRDSYTAEGFCGMCAKKSISVLVWRAYKLPKMHQEKAINTAIDLAKERVEDI